MKSIGERINEFDSLETQTVGTFNELFPECPIKDFHDLNEVEIGQYIGADRRSILVRGELIQYKMFRDVLYGMDRDLFESQEEKELDDMYGWAL